MTVLTYLNPTEVDSAAVQGRAAVVIDAIRATSTMVEALANGARAIYPTVSTEEAIRLANSMGREDTLLCGERKGLKVEGFDLGNSPREFTRDRVEGKRLVMSTTNGTRALVAAASARRVLVASFLNLDAVVEALSGEEELVMVCAGKDDRFGLDDTLCAGLLVNALRGEESEGERWNDASRAAAALARGRAVTADLLAGTEAGRALVEVGLEDDLPICAHTNRHAIVPEMEDRMIRLGDVPASPPREAPGPGSTSV